MENQRKTRFDDHLSTIEAAHSKTASANQKTGAGNDLLTKLAEELGLGNDKNEAAAAAAAGAPEAGAAGGASTETGAAPKAEGEVIPAASGVTGAAPAVAEATDAVAMPQVAMAGGVPAVAEVGSAPNPETVVMPIISAADGKAETATELHRTPEAVAAAAEPTSKDESAEAEKIGKLIATSFQNTLEKSAQDQEFAEAIGILKEAGLLESYKIKDEELTKTAEAHEGFLEKIANNQPLTKDDIIGAAYELVEFQKQAEFADAEGREAAQNLVELMKMAQGDTEEKEEKAEEKTEEEGEEKEASDNDAQQKIAALLSDPKVVEAVKTLKAKNVL